jgi:hypothetical protein
MDQVSSHNSLDDDLLASAKDEDSEDKKLTEKKTSQ